MDKISLCLTNWNRTEMLGESFIQVLNDDRISEVIISDDCSDEQTRTYLRLLELVSPKIKVFPHYENVGMSRNKYHSVSYAKENWCIVFDSDNVLTTEYIDAIYKQKGATSWDENVIYCPSFARPQFDYRAFNSLTFHKRSVKKYLNKKMFDCLLNTCNYFVNRVNYLTVFEHNPEMKGTDTIWFNYLWLKAGHSFHVVPGMQYDHRVHDGSGFMADASYNMKKAEEMKRKISRL